VPVDLVQLFSLVLLAPLFGLDDTAGVFSRVWHRDLKEDEVPLYTSITHGLLLLIGHWYENREMVTERPLSEAPATTYTLWAPHIWHHLGDTAP